MDHLSKAMPALPDDGIFIPDDGVCSCCGGLMRNHAGVEKVLAARSLKYYNPENGRMVIKAGIPYCRCQSYRPPGTPWEMRQRSKRGTT